MSLYKMILVDDEEDVRVSIERKVDWNSLGFELVGSVSNGEEALELTERIHVDVVMTDIKMPFMDGLTLCSKVKENYKNTKVVLCSGFDDFEFAREAIHLEAEEYLLKPIGAQDLENVFRKIKENLDKEISERRNTENLHDYYLKSLPMMREQFLAGLLVGRVSGAQAENMIHSYEMDLFSPYYSVALLGVDNRKRSKDVSSHQMQLLSLMNLAKEYLEKSLQVHTLMFFDYVAIIACLKEPRELSDFIYHMDQICKMGFHMLELNVSAGIGHLYSQLDKICVSYEEARNAIEYRVLAENGNQAIYIKDVEPTLAEELPEQPQGMLEVFHQMKLGTREELLAAIEEFVKELRSYKLSSQQYQIVFMEIMMEVLKLIRIHKLDSREIFGKTLNPYEEVGKLYSLEEVAVWLKDKGTKIWIMIRKERVNNQNSMTEKSKRYIEEHYADSSLSVEDICSYLNVSATYFSVVFKKELGMSFVSYLTQVRLEHAVELLNNTDEKSYIIAEKVGYTDANYFSYVFKKQYGMSPTKYKQSKGK